MELEIGVVATCNVSGTGHRIRLELSNFELRLDGASGRHGGYRKVLRLPALTTVLAGPAGSRVSLPALAR